MNDNLINIVKEAGKILKTGFYSEKNVTFKSKVDLITEYDLKIELYLKDKLKSLYIDFEIIGEETSNGKTSSARKKFI